MALSRIKSTYSLDVETVRQLERMAARLGVSKSEALRRAIRAAAEDTAGHRETVAALEELQRSVRLAPEAAGDWAKLVRQERRATSRLREGGKR